MGDPTPAPAAPPSPPDRGRRLLQVSSHLSSASMITAGIVGGWAMSRFGPTLAMGLAILDANTEPTPPSLPYPWWLFALGVAAWAGGFTWSQRQPDQLGALALEQGGGGFVAVLPVIHLLRLWMQT